MPPADHDERVNRARLAVQALAIGEGFAERLALSAGSIHARIEARALPEPPWEHAAGTQMALAVLELLERDGAIVEAPLASALAARYQADPGRGYTQAAHWVLASIAGGLPWGEAAASLEGPLASGHEAAVRAAPIGAYFAGDAARAASEALASARATEPDPERRAGAAAVAAACAAAASGGAALVEAAIEHTADGPTRELLRRARASLASGVSAEIAAGTLGSAIGPDPVVFGIYCAALARGDLGDAVWSAANARERAACCAIAAAISALAGGIEDGWLVAAEPLPG